MRRIIVLTVIYATTVFADGLEHKFMAYNLLYYGDDADTSRDSYFRTIINDVEPDLILGSEIIGADGGADQFLTNVLEAVAPNEWALATFTNQPAEQDIGLYYKTDHFNFISTSTLDTKQGYYNRDVIEFVVEHGSSGVEFRVYGVHFQASSGSSNYTERGAEAAALRTYLNDLDGGIHFVVAGDFNFYSSNTSGSYQEPGYNTLIEVGSDSSGRVFDPIDSPGTWHNGTGFAEIHTQSPRANSFGAGVGGGMDDRFDFILASTQVMNDTYEMTYVEDSYSAFGNDGQRCCNGSINSDPANSAVSADVADALYYASDHIPVVATFRFPPGETDTAAQIVISEIMPNPAAVSDSYGEWFEVTNADSVAVDLNGWVIKDDGSDTHTISVTDSLVISPGEYAVFGRHEDSTQNGGYTPDYVYSDFSLANSSDEIIMLDTAQNTVDKVTYTTSFPFANGASMYVSDFSTDNNADSNWAVSNYSYGDGDLGTPGRAWDDTTTATAAIGNENILPTRFILYPAYPNPFNPITTIQFYMPVGVIHELPLQLRIYDITGQLVETLIQGKIEPGIHEIRWDASAEPSGVYFVHLQNGDFHQTTKVILLK